MKYIVVPERKTLVLACKEREKILNIFPTAKEFTYKGKQLIALPHQLDEVRVLNNLGVLAPAPILHYYDWPGQYKPMGPQRQAAAFLTVHPRAFNLSAMGSGKTLATLWAYDYLRSIGLLKSAIITAPLSTLERAWGDEIFKHFPHLSFSVLHGSKQRRLKLLEQRSDLYIVNHDGIEIIAPAVAQRSDIGLVVVDEVAVFRNSATDRYKALYKLVDRANMMVWGMTGTPIPNAPTDAWAQIRLVDKTRVSKHFGAFRDTTMSKISQFKWMAKPGAIDTVQAAMQPAIRFTREQCVELPPTTFTTYTVEMSPEQKAAYEQMKNRMRMEYENGQAQAVNEADKASKLSQIACGAVLMRGGQPIFIPAKSRVNLVKEIIEQSGSKVLVFVPFIAALKALHEELCKDWPFELVYGGTSKTDRDAAFSRLQDAPLRECRGIVANPAAMAHGLTLTAANTIIWFAPTNSHETFDQANHRIIRTSQKQKTLIAMIEGSPVEKKAYARLQSRQEMQGLLLELFNDQELPDKKHTGILVN
jgi:SNF2 family DNA or RNA helicase